MAIKSDFCKVINCGKLRDKSQGSSMCTMHRVRWSRFKSHDLPSKPPLPEGVVHICKTHGELQAEQAYTNDNYSSYQCIVCKQEAMKRYDSRNPGRDTNSIKNNYYIGKSKFKVSKIEYEKLFELQNGVCAICKRPETYRKSNSKKTGPKRLAIDHCHEAEKLGALEVRGLLCHSCNTMLGVKRSILYKSDAAQEYLKKHQS